MKPSLNAGRGISWKTEIRRLCRDFCLPTIVASGAINSAKSRPVPDFYKGNTEAFRYDCAYRMVKDAIKASLR